jgi:TRAP-type C4-dicarboxylate transport system permease small subunit
MIRPAVFGAATRSLSGVGVLALLIMVLWTVLDVVTRYALAKPLSGSIDLVEVALVLVVFLALPECFRREEQVTVDVVDHLAGERTVSVFRLLGLLCTAAFLGLLGYAGIQPLLDAWQYGDRKPDLPIPIFLLQGAIEIAVAVCLVAVLGQVPSQLRRVFAREAA